MTNPADPPGPVMISPAITRTRLVVAGGTAAGR
jgi:hypothetical protein